MLRKDELETIKEMIAAYPTTALQQLMVARLQEEIDKNPVQVIEDCREQIKVQQGILYHQMMERDK